MTPRSVTRMSALRASSSSCRICETRTHSCASPVAPSLMPSGLSRTTSRASSAEQPARWTVAANASTALVLRIPWEPMKATFAGRGQSTGAPGTGADEMLAGRAGRARGIAARVGRPAPSRGARGAARALRQRPPDRPARLEDHPDEAAQVRDRPDMAGLAGVDRPDRHPGHRPLAPDARRDHLDLEREAGLAAGQERDYEPPVDEEIPGLVVGDLAADRPRERAAAERVRQAPHGRHPAEVATADHQRIARDRAGDEKGGDRGRVVLPIAVEGDDRVEAALQRPPEARPQRGTLALVRVLDEHGRAGGLRLGRGGIRRSVIDDQDRQVGERLAHHVPDPGCLVEGRHEGEHAAAPRWVDPCAVLDARRLQPDVVNATPGEGMARREARLAPADHQRVDPPHDRFPLHPESGGTRRPSGGQGTATGEMPCGRGTRTGGVDGRNGSSYVETMISMSDSQATGPPPAAGRARPRPTLDGSWRPAIAGALAAGVAIAASELIAGLVQGAPSLVTAIGSLVISLQPPGAKDLVASLFGTNDKVALNVTVVVVALAVAAGTGILAARRRWFGEAVFVAFGLLAGAAALRDPLASQALAVGNAGVA